MMNKARRVKELEITSVKFTGASREQVMTGLLGWIAFIVNGSLRVSGVALRKTADGRLVTSSPVHVDRYGELHSCLRPIDEPCPP